MAWTIVGGPRGYDGTPDAADISVGWASDIERDGEPRAIRAEISASFLFSEEEHGFGAAQRALHEVLVEDDPPARLVLTSSGVVRVP